MPRISKYQSAPALCGEKKIWSAALYVRLSREDGDKIESDSVANQRTLLQSFVSGESDIRIHDIYIDDGYTGTNFERPSFQRLLCDMKDRTINCVIVKDLSRLGRNYIEVGEYIEKIFPFMDVRFISVGDMLDSVKNPQAMNNLIVPFKNIINDEYCRDISNKIRASLDMKRRQGKFIGSFATYGYCKDPSDHNHLIVDDDAAEVVRDIFDWFIGGMSIIGIAKKLNALGIPNPTAYKRNKGLNYRHSTGERNDGLWPDSSVRRILRNQVYTGCLVQGRNKIKSYKIHVAVAVPQSDWIIIAGTHEAIISEETFQKAQRLFQRDMRTSPASDHVFLLAGFMKCADCGRAMNRKLISQPYKDYCYYVCSTFKKMQKGACTKHTIRSDRVEQAVLETLKKQIDLAVEMDSLIEQIHQSNQRKKSASPLVKSLAAKQHERDQVEQMKLALYPDWKNGDISKEEYIQLKAGFDRRLSEITSTIQHLKQEMEVAADSIEERNGFLSTFIKHRNLTKLTREVMIELVDAIYVHEGGSLTIRLRFADAFSQVADYIQANRDCLVDASEA